MSSRAFDRGFLAGVSLSIGATGVHWLTFGGWGNGSQGQVITTAVLAVAYIAAAVWLVRRERSRHPVDS